MPETSGAAASPKPTSTVPSAASVTAPDRVREFVEQQIAAVEQVVRFGPLGHRAADHPVQERKFLRLRFDFAAFAGDRGVFAFRHFGSVGQLLVQFGEADAERLARFDHGLAGAGVFGAVGEPFPVGPEGLQLLRDPGFAWLGKRPFDRFHPLHARGEPAEAHRLGTVLEVEEAIAGAGHAGDVDPGPEFGLAVAGARAGVDPQRPAGAGRHLLARVAERVRVGDVVAGDVERLLLGDQPAQRGLQSHEGRDGHSVTPPRPSAGGRRAGILRR